jgi:hypothetical protein
MTTESIPEIVVNLKQRRGDLYQQLFALGRSLEGRSHRPLVAAFLDFETEPMVARLALQILCRWWGLYSDYRDEISRFLYPVAWDEDELIRLMAIGCAGELVLIDGEVSILRELHQIFCDETEDPIIRDAVYSALARAVGTPVADLPSASRLLESRDISAEVLKAVRKRLELHE